MPELPEVETIRRKLEPRLVGQRIVGVFVPRPSIIGCPGVAAFRRDVAGRSVVRLSRRGKYLIVELEREWRLAFHLRLSGHLELAGPNEHPAFERLRLVLSQGMSLSFIEPRALGRAYLFREQQIPDALAGMTRMGPEPVSPDFTAEYLADRLRARKASVKSLLLDQRVCCGVGNIYSDEALFRARVRPTRTAGRLTRPEVIRLARALTRVLRDGIRWCGTTLADGRYLLPDQARGRFQERLAVFGREGRPCRRRNCPGVIRRIRIGNRGTRFCPVCQR